MSSTIRLDDVRDIPDMSLTDEQIHAQLLAEREGGWTRVDLSDQQYAIPPDPPSLLGLIYTGRRHVLSGAPETAKTLVAYITLLTAIRDGWTVAIIDFEMGPTATRRLLVELGCTTQELAEIYYVAPNTPPADNLQTLIDHHAQLVLIDAAIGAYDTQDLDDNRRQDAEKFARTWITPLWQAGITTLLIDHVVKNLDNRGKFTIGSERKLGSADVHLGLEAVQTISRGTKGLVKVHVHKDRPGFLNKPACAMIHLDSDQDTHHITWRLETIEHTDEPLRPTTLMQKVSKWLQSQDEPASFSKIKTAVTGEDKFVAIATQYLIDEGYASEKPGPRDARLVSHEALFTDQEQPTPATPAPTPAPQASTTPAAASIAAGVEGVNEDVTPAEHQIDVYDPAVQAMLDYDNDIPF